MRFLHPFFDTDVVEMLYRVPPNVLSAGGRTKGLVRGTLAGRFPALGLSSQRKVPFRSFLHPLIQREAPALANAAGEYPSLSSLGVVDAKAMRRYVYEQLKQGGAKAERAFHILNLESWVRSHLQ
jgi:hypothetical protein